WDASTKVQRGTVAGLLTNTYKIPLGKWMLTEANCISGDGYTIGGRGINPQGKYEGWIALLPRILHPPVLANPGPQHANAGEDFRVQVQLTNPGSLTSDYVFSATGLPKGFNISQFGGGIRGTWSVDSATPGDYTVTVTAKNSEGSGSTTFILTL